MSAKKPKKKVSKKQAKSGSLARLRRLVSSYPVLMLCVLFVVGIAVASYAYNAITDFQDNRTAQQYKKQLDQIDKQMAVEFEKIITKLGDPDLEMHEKLCQYPSSDGDPGPPRCGPFYRASYRFTDVKTSDEFIELSKRLVSINTEFELTELGTYPQTDPQSITRDLIDTYDTENNIRCSYDVVRGTDDYSGQRGALPRHFYVYHNYDCSKSSPKPIYREVNK